VVIFVGVSIFWRIPDRRFELQRTAEEEDR
jgi:hypothetical protein